MRTVLPPVIAPATGIDTLAARRAVAALFTNREQARKEVEADRRLRREAAEAAAIRAQARAMVATMPRQVVEQRPLVWAMRGACSVC